MASLLPLLLCCYNDINTDDGGVVKSLFRLRRSTVCAATAPFGCPDFLTFILFAFL
jgi:hypothetical protein